MTLQSHPEALSAYEEAARYDAGCQAGLELRFIASVEAAVRQITDAPGRWRIVAPRELRRGRYR